ncbi:MAG: RDD family protein [Sphingobacteriales bacterium]|nr:MAG: RDD family protein [Sphingobacteriales bacterium]
MATVRVRTSQNVIVEHQVASLGDRVLGSIIDGAAIAVYYIGIIMIFSGLFVGGLTGMGDGNEAIYIILIIIFALPVFFYSLIFEIFFNGQSLGKMAMNTRVVRLDGSQPTIGNYFIRWIMRIVDFGIMSGAVAFICVAASDKAQRVGDMAAGTVVIKINRKTRLSDTLPTFSENTYVPVFPEVAQLNDSQAALIKEALDAYHYQDNYNVVDALSQKMRQLLQLNTNMPPLQLLQTLLKDYSNIHNK